MILREIPFGSNYHQIISNLEKFINHSDEFQKIFDNKLSQTFFIVRSEDDKCNHLILFNPSYLNVPFVKLHAGHKYDYFTAPDNTDEVFLEYFSGSYPENANNFPDILISQININILINNSKFKHSVHYLMNRPTTNRDKKKIYDMCNFLNKPLVRIES